MHRLGSEGNVSINVGRALTQHTDEAESLLGDQDHSDYGSIGGREVGVGDGDERNQVLESRNLAQQFFSAVGQSIAGAVRFLGNSLAGIFSSDAREARVDAKFQQDNQVMLQALSTPFTHGSLTSNDEVMDKLLAFAEDSGSPLSEGEIRDLVATGERISQAIFKSADGDPHGKVNVSAPHPDTDRPHSFEVQSGIHSTRALSWYMAANAAAVDVANKHTDDAISNLASQGAFILKDPGNRLYNFLNAAPTCDSRMSSHVTERSGTTEQHSVLGFLPSGKLAQRGIEDYRGQLPGQGGTLLFDRLKGGELFMKFESVGCPPFFGGSESHESGVGLGRFFGAIGRNMQHTFNFLNTRGNNVNGPARQEHVYKGVLEEPVYRPYTALMKDASDAGLISPEDARTAISQAKKMGLPLLMQNLTLLEQSLSPADDEGHGGPEGIRAGINELRDVIADYGLRMGGPGNGVMIERRGGEVHLAPHTRVGQLADTLNGRGDDDLIEIDLDL